MIPFPAVQCLNVWAEERFGAGTGVDLFPQRFLPGRNPGKKSSDISGLVALDQVEQGERIGGIAGVAAGDAREITLEDVAAGRRNPGRSG